MKDFARHFQGFLAGDDTAFAELYCEVNPRLSAYCHKLAPGRAEDLMQELWERVIALRSRSTAPPSVDSPLAYLFRMVKNLAIDEFRKTKNESLIEDYQTDLTDWSDENYQREEPTSVEAIILEALEKLSADDRELLVLNIYSGYTFGEIAEMLGLSPEAVWQRASRARVRLRTIVIEDAKRMGVALPRMNGRIDKKKETVV